MSLPDPHTSVAHTHIMHNAANKHADVHTNTHTNTHPLLRTKFIYLYQSARFWVLFISSHLLLKQHQPFKRELCFALQQQCFTHRHIIVNGSEFRQHRHRHPLFYSTYSLLPKPDIFVPHNAARQLTVHSRFLR